MRIVRYNRYSKNNVSFNNEKRNKNTEINISNISNNSGMFLKQ